MYRMEYPTEECEIEEESYYSEHSPQVDYSTGKVSWILNKGWGIGKKLLMTGAVISSAPFVLPPLVVTSAIAFACWVPCGVVMASYTCSEKFMSKLLPYNSNEDEVEFEDAEEDVKVDVGEYLDMEEKPLLEGINGARMEGSRYEYNDDVLLDENAISDGVDLVVFNVIEDGEEFGVSPIEVTSVRLEGSEAQEKVSDLLEGEELVKETRGLLEKIRDEGSADDGMEMENHYSVGTPGSRKDSMDILLDNNVVSDEVDIYVSNAIDGEKEIIIEEPEEKEIVNDFMEDEELVKETRGLLEKMRDAGSADNGAVAISEPYAGVIEQGEEEMDEITKSNFEETERAVDKTSTDAEGLGIPTSTMEGGLPKESEKSEEKIHVTDVNAVSEDWESVSESENADNNFGVERQIGEIRIVNNILGAEKSISEMTVDLRVVSTVVAETHVPVANKEEVLQAERAENNISHVTFPSINEKENVVSANADARKIADESGLYVFDENNASGNVGGEGADFAGLSISSRVSESTDAKISSQKDNIHSNGVLKNEDKIWKQIEAIQSIVGYKVTPHASYMEELKALYIFTGVEPPSSFNDPPDLAQVDNKLRFLMSIIGLK
ncbi:PREDICTED: uncharacterized protein LOC101307804 isoform 2 [Fragaria vesca subsp. vesca]